MDSSAIYQVIRQTVQSNLPGSRVLLFGSRARGDEDIFSDYDLLVIAPLTFSPQEKIRMSTQLDRAIVKAIQAPIDLLLNRVKKKYLRNSNYRVILSVQLSGKEKRYDTSTHCLYSVLDSFDRLF